MNCRLDRIEARFSAFETAVWNWYFENVNRFTLDSGIVADEFRRTGLRGWARRMALSALNRIYLTFQDVAAERRSKAQQEQLSG